MAARVSQHVVVGLAQRPAAARPRVVGAASAAYLQSLHRLVTPPPAPPDQPALPWVPPPRLGGQRYAPADCLGLEADLETALQSCCYFNEVTRDELFGELGSARRGDAYLRLVAALVGQNSDFLAGLQASPGRHSWHRVRAVRVLPHDGEQARQLLLSVGQAQQLTVQVSGVTVLVPVKLVTVDLPAGQVQVVVRGLPPQYARYGVVSALLAAAGYPAGGGATVVHERAGRISLPDDVAGELLCFDSVVAVVAVPADDPCLRMLPEVVDTEGWAASITVTPSIADSPGVLMRRQSDRRQHAASGDDGSHQPAAPPPPPSGVPPSSRLGASLAAGGGGGLGGVHRAAPSAADMLVGARAPRDRRGLGFPQAALQADGMQPREELPQHQQQLQSVLPVDGQPPGGPAAAVLQQGQGGLMVQQQQPAGHQGAGEGAAVPALGGEGQPQPMQGVTQSAPAAQPTEAAMVPAPPLPAVAAEPGSEPGFGVAIEYVTDCSDLPRSDAVALIMAVRAHSPAVYAAVREASSPGDLTQAFREALYTQARGQFGEELALQLSVPQRVVLDGDDEPMVQLHGVQRGQPGVASLEPGAFVPSRVPPPHAGPHPPSSASGASSRQQRGRRRPLPGGGITYWQIGAQSARGTPSERSASPPPPPSRGASTGRKQKKKAAPAGGRRPAP